MLIHSLQVDGFRNLKSQVIELSKGINVLVGNNGQGKTNVLEAIHVLATLRSFRPSNIRDMIQQSCSQAHLAGFVTANQVPSWLKVQLQGNARRAWFGEKAINEVKEYLGILRLLAFTPDDLSMIKGGPSIRRRFLDRTAFLFNPNHLSLVRDYHLVLRSRNKALKDAGRFDDQVIDSYSQSLARIGSQLTSERISLLKKIGPTCERILNQLRDSSDNIKIDFSSGWKKSPSQENPDSTELLRLLREHQESDKRRRLTTIGSQHDDFDFVFHGGSARTHASQGQQRLLAICVLLAVMEETEISKQEKPILLLDDVSSELDETHRRRLFECVVSLGGQALVTTTDRHLANELSGPMAKWFVISGGQVKEENQTS